MEQVQNHELSKPGNEDSSNCDPRADEIEDDHIAVQNSMVLEKENAPSYMLLPRRMIAISWKEWKSTEHVQYVHWQV